MASLFSSRSTRAGNGLRRAAASAFVAMMVILICSAAGASTLEEDFQQPPDTARPYVWWHWMGPNFSKEGITKDLEAMKLAGIGGATIFNLTSSVHDRYAPTLNNPWPQTGYRSDGYWQAVRHAADEAERLGLEIGLHNTVGYPDWFIKGLPRPSEGRRCFVTWYYHRADTPLLPSGLIGPVRVLIHPEPEEHDQQKFQH